MHDIIGLILRIVAFASTFYFLCEYIVNCTIPTWVGIVSILSILVSVSLFYILIRCKYMYRCTVCKKPLLKSHVGQ
jgi:hypothetical protein